MRFLQVSINIKDIDRNLNFFLNILGLKEIERYSINMKRQTIISLSAPNDYLRATAHRSPVIELIYNWDNITTPIVTNNVKISFEVDNLYDLCHVALKENISFLLLPHNGRTAILHSPEGFAVQLYQKGDALAKDSFWQNLYLGGYPKREIF